MFNRGLVLDNMPIDKLWFSPKYFYDLKFGFFQITSLLSHTHTNPPFSFPASPGSTHEAATGLSGRLQFFICIWCEKPGLLLTPQHPCVLLPLRFISLRTNEVGLCPRPARLSYLAIICTSVLLGSVESQRYYLEFITNTLQNEKKARIYFTLEFSIRCFIFVLSQFIYSILLYLCLTCSCCSSG